MTAAQTREAGAEAGEALWATRNVLCWRHDADLARESGGVPVEAACNSADEALRTARGQVARPLLLADEGYWRTLKPGPKRLSLFDLPRHIDDDEAALALGRVTLGGG
jgi:hypothetical protein